ncbi:FAD dependent oxidoreductase [Biscogniauxia mediterranea]|nr:FAD dependent oxidoreductase [Biscogniauxia mediterranea]
MLFKESSILVIGAGTWGCGITLELARNGYTDVTVLDAEDVPSSIAAGNDFNKIMDEGPPSTGDTDAVYAWNRLHNICTDSWLNDTLYKPFYHRNGYVMAASSDTAYTALEEEIQGREADYVPVTTPEEFRSTMPEGVLTGDFVDWRGFKKSKAGWVFAKGAIIAAQQEAERLGAKFVTGTEGKVVELIFSNRSNTAGQRHLEGVKTADGTIHRADTTILSSGANADLMFDLKSQLRPTAWTLAHIQMTAEEAALYKDLPVLFNIEKGFFIEPSAETHELKICDEHPGYINPVYSANHTVIGSRPFARQEIPIESESRIRALLSETMPQLANRTFSFARICWDADTPDRMPLIDWYGAQNSTGNKSNFLLAIGGSGHSFKIMPAIGQVVREYLEGREDNRTRNAFRWRPETAVNRNWWDVQGRFGADNKVMDFADVSAWTTIGE